MSGARLMMGACGQGKELCCLWTGCVRRRQHGIEWVGLSVVYFCMVRGSVHVASRLVLLTIDPTEKSISFGRTQAGVSLHRDKQKRVEVFS